MHTLPVYSQAGEPTGESFSLDLAKIADGVNKVLLHDAVVMYQANLRVGTAKTKTRAEVSGSGKKMYKQKGTGNARMGNKRTPVRRGGGHCFAKRPKDWGYRMPAKALKLATRMAILSKFVDDQVTVVDSIQLEAPKTSAISKMVTTLQKDEISFGSLETKYHAPDKATITAVRDMLFKWINILGKL